MHFNMLSPKRLYCPLGCLLIVPFFPGCSGEETSYVEVEEEPAPEVFNEAPVADPHTAAAPSDVGFSYDVPEGWHPQPASSMKLLSLVAGRPPEELTELSVSAFPGDVGGKAANINRWRRQVGLGPIDETAVEGFVTDVSISGKEGWRVDFSGPEGTSERGGASRVVVSTVMIDGKSWFFKLMGEANAVTDELSRYDAFLTSVTF